MKKATFILTLLVALSLSGQELPTVIPPTPDVSSLGKFGEYPIATNYGTVPISIPLFELKSGDITVPVSISYHSSGIKVNEEASSIGLGWVLNAGGNISKAVRGANDRSIKRSEDTNNTSFIHDGANTLNDYFNIKPTLTTGNDNPEVFYMDYGLASKEIDGESDNYFFNFLNYSGKFIFKGSGAKEIMVYPQQQNLKFEFKENNGLVGLGYDDDFYAVDDKGFEYWFNDQENVFTQFSHTEPHYKSATSWNLSRIYSKNTNRYVIFDYNDFDYSKWNYSFYNDITRSLIDYEFPSFLSTYNNRYRHRVAGNLLDYQTKALKEIRANNGDGPKLVFETVEDRQDTSGSKSFRYTSITLVNQHGQRIKRVDFHHTYFQSNGGHVENFGNTTEGHKRLRLDSITITGKSETDKQVYSFDYHDRKLPHINSLEKDYWGYYNGRDPRKILPSTPYTTYKGANLKPNSDVVLAGSLKRIHYPTGGYSEFDFEINQVYTSEISEPLLENISRNYSRSGICQNNHNETYYEQLDAEGVVLNGIDVEIILPDIPGDAFGITHPKDVVDSYFAQIGGAGNRIEIDGSGYKLVNGVYKHDPIIVNNQTFVNQATDQDILLIYYKYICDNKQQNAYGPRINISFDRRREGTEQYHNALAGGLRIKRITNVNEDGVTEIKEYDYTDENDNSTGKFVYEGELPIKDHIHQSYQGGSSSRPLLNQGTWGLTRVFDTSPRDLGFSGSVVCYSLVTETTKCIDQNTGNIKQDSNGNDISLGKIEYHYNTPQNRSLGHFEFPYSPLKDLSHKRTLKSKVTYNSNGKIVSKEEYNYVYEPLEEVTQLKARGKIAFLQFIVRQAEPGGTGSSCNKVAEYLSEEETYKEAYLLLKDGTYDNCNAGFTIFANYPYSDHYILSNEYLKQQGTKVTQYDISGNNPVITASKQFYGSSTLMTQSDVLDSRNGRLRTIYYYPQDIPNANALAVGGAFTPSEYNDILLLNSDRSSAIVQTENYRSTSPLLEDDDGKLLSAQRTIYDSYPYQGVNGNSKYFQLPKTIKILKETNNQTNNGLIDRITYHSYDNNGNPIEVSRVDGASIYYIWGYNKEYPIAKIENFTTAQVTAIQNLVTAAENASDLDNDRTIDTYTNNLRTYVGNEGSLRQKLDALRTSSSLSNAMITTFTYDPLIGVTSVTDPKGYTTYYHYDDFNRLQYVKDASGNLVTDYKYHYKNQQ